MTFLSDKIKNEWNTKDKKEDKKEDGWKIIKTNIQCDPNDPWGV
jgi:hypothetical protein